MKNFLFLFCFAIFLAFTSCHRAKTAINEGGEAVGKAGGEFANGVAKGVEKTFDCEISVSGPLQQGGVHTGTYHVSDVDGGNNNRLSLYLIFDKELGHDFTVKVFDENGLEAGRAKLHIDAKAGDAGYYDFDFDPRTKIGLKSKITVE